MKNGIQTTIDSAGRLALPKIVHEGRIEIEPVPREVRIVQRALYGSPFLSRRGRHSRRRPCSGSVGRFASLAVDSKGLITALDTNVIIAGLLSWHEHHAVASAQLITLLEDKAEIVLPLHALVEAYSVMTRLPPPHRIGSTTALTILESSFRHRTTLVGLDGDEEWDLIDEIGRQSISGGTSYDGLILACARKGGAQRLLTFNRQHFERFKTEGIEIVAPDLPSGQPRGSGAL